MCAANHECPSVSCILCKYAAVALKVKTGCVSFYYDVCGVVRVECPEGRFGEQCSQTCGCQNGARCDHVSGRCSCTAGWTGVSCELREYHSARLLSVEVKKKQNQKNS